MINKKSKLAREFWEHGKAADCPIIDFHAHMWTWTGGYMPACTPERMLVTMDQCHTKIALFSGHEAISAPTTRQQADMDAVRRYPDRFKAYFAFNGNSEDLKADLKRLQKNRDVFVGLKTLPDYFRYPINADCYTPFYEYASDQNLLFLCHTWGGSPGNGVPEAEKFLQRYPKITFIAGHSFHSDWDEAARLCNTYPNLYLELTAVFDERGPLELFLEKCGSQKILFGTDLPWFDTHHGIGTILATDMSDDDRRNIFYRNGEKLLCKYPWFNSMWPAKVP
jgi:predicted TIM-barrel fold metal-dependent hydrolase